ncbi:hypothetical protein C3L57_07010 [Veillonellaceae bacterium M2-8]|nr:hypothetical protein [Veillonellaceae bacterium M2-8]
MDTPINQNIKMSEAESVRKKISLENEEILRHRRALQELKIQQKKIGLRRLGIAITTFIDGACFLKLSEDGNAVCIQFEKGIKQTIKLSDDSGIKMLYDVLKYGFIGEKEDGWISIAKTTDKVE